VLFLAPIFELPLLAAALFFGISALALAFSSATYSFFPVFVELFCFVPQSTVLPITPELVLAPNIFLALLSIDVMVRALSSARRSSREQTSNARVTLSQR
jgi:hypothetical protein